MLLLGHMLLATYNISFLLGCKILSYYLLWTCFFRPTLTAQVTLWGG